MPPAALPPDLRQINVIQLVCSDDLGAFQQLRIISLQFCVDGTDICNGITSLNRSGIHDVNQNLCALDVL